MEETRLSETFIPDRFKKKQEMNEENRRGVHHILLMNLPKLICCFLAVNFMAGVKLRKKTLLQNLAQGVRVRYL